MEPRIKYNQYTVGEHGSWVDVSTGKMLEGEILSVIDDRTGYSDAVYLKIQVERGVETIKVA